MRISKYFKDVFIGEYVNIVIKNVEAYNSYVDDSHGSVSVKGAAVSEGFVLNFDSNYVYLGDTAEEINQAVPLDLIARIQIVPQQDEDYILLQDLEPPGGMN